MFNPKPRRQEEAVLVFRAWTLRCIWHLSIVPSRAVEWMAMVPIFALSGQWRGALGADVCLRIRACALSVRRIGVDRQAWGGRVTTDECSCRWRRRKSQGCGILQHNVESRWARRLPLVVGHREENRFEGELLQPIVWGMWFRHETDGSGPGTSGRQVLRADPDGARGKDCRSTDERGIAAVVRGPNATRPGNARAPGRFPGRALGETLDIVTFERRKSPERQLSFGQRGNLCDVRRP